MSGNELTALLVSGGNLIVAGALTVIGGAPRQNIWQACDTRVQPPLAAMLVDVTQRIVRYLFSLQGHCVNRFLSGLLMVLAALPALAGERWKGSVTARVAIDSAGQVTNVKFDRTTVGRGMKKALLARVHAVKFEPALLDGVPAAAEATICIELGVDQSDAGLNVMVDNVSVIAGYRKTSPPRYPAAQLRRGVSASVELQLDYDAEGRVVAVVPAHADAPMDEFMVAALKVAKNWELEPQRIGGLGVPGSARIPVRFVIADESPKQSGSGVLNFRDGGKLRVYRTAETQTMLADSRIRVRSVTDAQGVVGGG